MSSSAVFVMPRGLAAWPGAEALWVTARGWARAAEDLLGAAWIATPDGAWEAGLLPRRAVVGGPRGRLRIPLPTMARTLAKDLTLCARQAAFEVAVEGPWSASRVRFVWEHHDLFNAAGRRLAAATGAPLVRYVHAPQVWEARKWGVRRPLWGRAVESFERRNLRNADLVACVSSQVRDRLLAMGVAPERVLISPMAVEPGHFSADGDTARPALGIPGDAVVVGWCGSFRPFHGLDQLVEAFGAAARRRPDLHLLLIGEGPMRSGLEAVIAGSAIAGRVTFTGAVPHHEMPRYLRSADITVVSADGRAGFHYSPLKLREYAACGRPVVAPAEGELEELGASGFVNLHAPGDLHALSEELDRLASDASLRARQGRAARAYTLEHWTWRAQVQKVLARLGQGPEDGRA